MDEKAKEVEPTPPNLYVNNALEDLKAAKESHLDSADKLDYSINVLETGKEYWDGVDPTSFRITPSGIATVNFLVSMAQEASFLKGVAVNDNEQIQSFNSTTGSFVSVTSTANSFVCRVESFNPEKIYQSINKPEKDEEYSQKFEAFDPELGSLYRQFLQILRRTTSHPGKSVLPNVRQAYDHLMRVLAPDDEVRAQKDWLPVDPKEPEMVTRAQRLEYAAKRHIKDERRKATILASTNHILAVYKDLNKLFHDEKPLDDDIAIAVSQSMIEVLNQWADAISL